VDGAPGVWSEAMARTAAAVVLAIVVLSLTPIAHACPPDPTWISGFYDDNDYDDIVLFLTGLTAVSAAIADPIGPIAISLGQVDPSRPHTVPVRSFASRSTRAPPPALP
jgi:hypothetical protein